MDVWDTDRVVFVEYTAAPPSPGHTLTGQIHEVSGVMVNMLGVLRPDAVELWPSMRKPDEVPMPLSEIPVDEALADLAACLRQSDMTWPRQDDEHFVETRALTWTRCRAYLPDWPDFEPLSDAGRSDLTQAFLAEVKAEHGEPADVETQRSLAELFLDYGDGYLHSRPLGWSPDAVVLFLTDWLPRKVALDAAQRAGLPDALRRWLQFALHRRGVEQEWIDPVVAEVDEWLPEFEEAFDDESSWGPAKQIAAELAARGVDLTDSVATEQAIRSLNAERLARRLTE